MGSFRFPVEEIRTRCDLVEVISTYVNLKKSGRNFKGLCPFHNEKTPSFTVNPDTQRYKCWGCGESGDVFSFLMRIEGLTFAEAVEQLARKTGVQIEKSPEQARQISERERIFRINTLALGFFRKALNSSTAAKEYLARRGITQETQERYRIGYAPNEWQALGDYLASHKVSMQDALKAGLVIKRENGSGYYDRFRERIIFPILDVQDRVVAFGGRAIGDGEPKYLNSPESPVFFKNKTLYGLNVARRTIHKEDRVIVVEGYMDVITVQSAGFENTVATMGTALTQEHVNILSRYTQKAVLAFDSDSAGMSAALRSAPMFEDAGFSVRVIAMPSGQDPDSLLRAGDTAAFARLIEEALPLADFRVKKIKEKYDLTTREGKVSALKEILPVLAEIQDTVERERLITEIAPMHPNYGTGTTLAEDHLRQETERLRAKRVESSRLVDRQRQQQAPPPRVTVGHSGIGMAERTLLGIILCRKPDAGQALELKPHEYVHDAAQSLAAAVHSQFDILGKLELSQLAAEVEGTPAGDLLSEILVKGETPEMTSQSAMELVEVIRKHKKKEKLRKFRLLAEKFETGQYTPEELEEFMRLNKELKGTGSI